MRHIIYVTFVCHLIQFLCILVMPFSPYFFAVFWVSLLILSLTSLQHCLWNLPNSLDPDLIPVINMFTCYIFIFFAVFRLNLLFYSQALILHFQSLYNCFCKWMAREFWFSFLFLSLLSYFPRSVSTPVYYHFYPFTDFIGKVLSSTKLKYFMYSPSIFNHFFSSQVSWRHFTEPLETVYLPLEGTYLMNVFRWVPS